MNRNLYIITSIFNPFGFASRYRLYENFKRHMEESGAKLFTIEAAFGDQPFRVTSPDNPMNAQLRTNQVLWHKERLINIAAERLLHVVPDLRFLGWYDSDITFANPDWVAEVLHKLTHLAVIQPFSEAINLNSNEEYMWNCPGTIRHFLHTRGFHQFPPMPTSYTHKGHPGLAWNATREAFEAMGGLYDRCVAGSADSIMGNAFKGDWSVYLPGKPTAAMIGSIKTWSEKSGKIVRGKVGYTRGLLLHHWHGHSEQRGYEKRWDIMSFHQFDPMSDLRKDESGLWRWAGNKPQLEDDIRLSLGSRNEDEI